MDRSVLWKDVSSWRLVVSLAMPQGEHSFTYELRAESPGTYHVMPTHAYAMYVPDVTKVRGQRASDVGVEDRGQPPLENASISAGVRWLYQVGTIAGVLEFGARSASAMNSFSSST